ncbi:Hpt domain-containing protein [Pseudomonas sp.]|uniref:Hpt domain-containing protein n=1 Tax=Pseudomonas sp. TaxID=306 RepID=UPI0019DDE3A7|nr:Hpt domain-containing protein [Pseudomonas sp.]MBF0673637.1 Hpt domain-containing protein [Pseudomonas sp.]
MGDRHDYVALEWVKGEIAETLKQARQALEAFVENREDTTRLRFCLTYVHQVHGTLQMVEFYGAALLAEEMEHLAQALMENRVGDQGEALEVMMQAILQLPAYLDSIQSARRDLPMVVLPLLNDLRAARGEKLLSETSLFAPDLSGRAPALSGESIDRLRTAELPALLRKLRQMQQAALIGLIRNQDLPTNLNYLARVFARLETLCKDAPLGALWQIAAGLIEGLANGGVAQGTSVRTLLRQLDKELKRLVSEGADGFNRAAPDELTKNLLFYVAKAQVDSPRITALKARYRLDEALPDSALVNAERARLAGPDRDAIRSVVTALCEELVRVKDSLDLFVRSDRQSAQELVTLQTPLKQIADTLAVLGFAQPRKVIVDQLDTVQQLIDGQRSADDAVLMDVAGALLYVEATLTGMAGVASDTPNEQNHLPTTDVAQIHQLVIREARTGLEQAKDAIIEFIASQWNHQHLARVPELLTQVRGGLGMIPLARAATLLDACNRYIQEQLLAHQAIPDWQHLDTLADAITSVEYYLERLAEDHVSQGELILDVAEDSLCSLGYPIGGAEPAHIPEPTQPLELEQSWEPAPHDEAALPSLAEFVDDLFVETEPQWQIDDAAPLDADLSDVDEDATPFDDGKQFLFELLELDPPAAEAQTTETTPATQDDALPELMELEQAAETWDVLDLTALDLPEVDLPMAASAAPPAVEPSVQSVADVLATPVQAINPPAHDVPPSLLPPPADEEPVDEELLEVFVEEAGEVLETLNEYLPRWRADVDDRDALTEVRRAFHTLKGSGRMVRALIIGELAWSIENLFNRILDRSIEPTAVLHDVVGNVIMLLPELIDEFAAKAQRQRADVDHLAAAAHALAKGETFASPLPAEPATPAADTAHEAHAQPAVQPAGEGLDPQLLEIFRNEAESHLQTLARFLDECADLLPQPINDSLQRALHTLKGSAHMAGILPMAEIAKPLEKLVKEFHTHQIPVDMTLAELLGEAAQLLEQGLQQLDSQPYARIPGTDHFLQAVQRLHETRLARSQQEHDEQGGSRDPGPIGRFLHEGMDILLDAEQWLRRWRAQPSDAQPLNALREELNTLEGGARRADLPQIAELCQALLTLYGAVDQGRVMAGDDFFAEAQGAHEDLIGMLDQVAAALQVDPCPERITALQALLTQQDSAPAVDQPDAGEAVETRLALNADLDEEMVDIFLEEAVDILDSASQALDDWLAAPANLSALNALQRDLHTLKGGARMAEIAPIGDLAHELESLYEGLLDKRFTPAPTLAWLLHKCHDRLDQQLEQLQARQALSPSTALIRAILEFRQTGEVRLDSPRQPAVPEQPLTAPLAQLDNTAAEPAEPSPATDLWAALEAAVDSVQFEELDNLDGLDPLDELDDSFSLDETPAVSEPLPLAEVFDLDVQSDPELLALFLEECFGLIDNASAALLRWHADPQNSLETETLQRDLHTIKGCARMADIAPIGDLAEQLEALYQGLAAGELRAGEGLLDLLESSHQRLQEMLEAVRDQRPLPEAQDLIDTLEQFCANPEEQLSVPPSVILQAAPEAPAAAVDEVDSEILEIFREEADELLEDLEATFARWESQADDLSPINDLLRLLHTLKGGARLAAQTRIGDLSHDLEQRLSEASHAGTPAQSLLIAAQDDFKALQQAVDQLRGKVSAAPPAEPQSLPGQFDNLPTITKPMPVEPAMPVTKTLPFVKRSEQAALEAASRRAPQELVKVPADLLEGLVNLAGETSIFRGRVEQQVSDVGYTLGEMEATIERVRDQLRRLDTETQAQILSRYQAEAERSGYEEFDPLEMDRHSQLQQLSRALFESASDLFDLKETLATKNRDAETLLLQQARVNTELQEGLMRTRMVPFDRLVPRLRRIVRQVAGELGKQVDLVVSNAEGEMDRSVLERIVAPLEHMLRNAVDHGIESVEARRAAGKPEQGRIALNLSREGGEIVLSLSDDGAGIRLEAVRRKAIERGLMQPDSDLSDHEVLQFILAAGFSTAEAITQISGRGVGLDVVNSEVRQLGGSMSIESTPGKGTRFLVRLPFTVSVNRALMVLSGEDLYAIPLNTIEGIVRVSPFELEAYYQPEAPRFEYAGQAYQLRYLGDLLNNGQHPKLVGQNLPLPVILVRSAEHAVAVQVDSLAGSREIVVKSLGPQFAGVPGISGATLLGDGRVVVILDLLATLRSLQGRLALHYRRSATPLLSEETDSQRPIRVMVVDDSVTVRKVTSRLLERHGMQVLLAKDGVDAIAQLQEHQPDLMLLDVEMPRMDGFEVATLVRHDEQLKDLPIIMITSRTGEKHRERAMAIGVNDYLGKPYQEALLLERIAALVQRP